MSVPKPSNLQKRIVVTKRRLMTAGVTGVGPRVTAAMTLPNLPPNDSEFIQIIKDIVEGIRYVFQTTNKYCFAINGPISLAFETALHNLLDPGETIMTVIHGVKGERMAKTSKAMGFKVLRVKTANPGDLIEKSFIQNSVEKHRPRILFLCHGDDSVGTLQPLRGIGTLCHENDCLFFVDASSTLACAPLNSDQMEIDVLIASTEYALGVSPGLSLISFGQKAIDLIRAKKRDGIYTMNFDLLVQSWGLSATDESTKYMSHFTPPVSLLYGLRESLAMIVEEGLDRTISRHMKASITAQTEISKTGLKFLVTDEHKRLFSVLVILVPDSIRRDAIIEYLLKYYDIVISDGMPPIDKVWRIGLLGPNASRQSVKLLLAVLRDAIEKAQKSKSKSSLSSPSTIN